MHRSKTYSHQSSWRAKTNIDKCASSPFKSKETECLHPPFSMIAQPLNIKHTKQQHIILNTICLLWTWQSMCSINH
jgi:hypothetical protein